MVLSKRSLATSSRALKKDHPWSDYLKNSPTPQLTITKILIVFKKKGEKNG
jgi:hypothetical protein